jgi:hypothetical protein
MADDLTVEEARQAVRAVVAWAQGVLDALEAAEAGRVEPTTMDELATWMHERGYLRDEFNSDTEFKAFLYRLHKSDLAAQQRK